MDAVEQDLLAAIARDPEDPAPYLVYADWLQGRGGLRGELMTLQNATDERPGDHRIADAALDHVRAHAQFYLGPLARYLDEPEFLGLGWRCGFIASAELTWNRRWRGFARPPEMSPSTVLSELLQLDAARFLTRLVVEPTHELDNTFIREALVAHLPSTLRRLWIGPRDVWSASRDSELGALDFWHRVPELRELVVHGAPSTLGALELPHLRDATFQLDPSATNRVELAVEIGRAGWPELERLHVWNPHAKGIRQLLERSDLVVLGDFGVINSDLADTAARLIAASPLAPQLFRLSLAKGTLTDAGIDALVARRDQLASLRTIDVSETFVTADGITRLRTFVPEVVARDLRTGSPRVAITPISRLPDE